MPLLRKFRCLTEKRNENRKKETKPENRSPYATLCVRVCVHLPTTTFFIPFLILTRFRSGEQRIISFVFIAHNTTIECEFDDTTVSIFLCVSLAVFTFVFVWNDAKSKRKNEKKNEKDFLFFMFTSSASRGCLLCPHGRALEP